MKVLGYISNTHHCGFSYVEDGEIKGCFLEERFSRIKTANDPQNIPEISLKEIQNYFNIDIKNDDIILTTTTPIFVKINDLVLNGLTNQFLDMGKKIYVYQHHLCHAIPTHFTSGFTEKTLNLVIDGSESNNIDTPTILTSENRNNFNYRFRNSKWCSVFSAENDKLTNLKSYIGTPYSFKEVGWTNTHNTLPSLWTIIMPYFGFKANKDEGKLMGLAARGKFNKKIYDTLKPCFNYKNLEFDLFAANTFRMAMDFLIKNNNMEDLDFRSDLCYCFQKLTEDTTLQFVIDLYHKYPNHKKLCLSGGLFANVKLNQKLNEYTPFEEIYIMPAMGDEGVALGSAMSHFYENNHQLSNKRWVNVFLGIGYTQKEMDNLIDNTLHETEDYNPVKVAKYLQNGKVIGTFQGRSEFGPRALGARSIMVEPTKKETHDYINKKLDRHEVMPFAPIVMSEHISDVCYAYKSLRSAEFMTLCYTVKDEWASKIPAVINTYDNTARPQVVYKERNLHFHEILNEFNKLTGIPVLMNTSFNSHGEPIINHPQHAIDHLNKGSVDYLILGNKIIKKKEKKLKVFTVIDSSFRERSKNKNSELLKENGFPLLFDSALEKKLPFQVVVNNGRIDGSYYSKIFPIINFLKSCNDDDIVLYVDAFDVLFLDNEEDILRKFESTKCKFLVSGEIFCYPFDTLEEKILEKTKKYISEGIYKLEPENNLLFRNPCAGMMIGYKTYFLEKILKWKEIIENGIFPHSNIVPKSVYEKSDQGACSIDYVNSDDFMRIDMYPKVFMNHMYVSRSVFYLNNGKVNYQSVLNSNQEFPSVIHFNGVTFPSIFDFSTALNLSKNKTVIKKEDKILKIQINEKLKKSVELKIFNEINEIEYEITFDENEPDLVRNVSSKSVNQNLKFRVELSYQGYTFYKQNF